MKLILVLNDCSDLNSRSMWINLEVGRDDYKQLMGRYVLRHGRFEPYEYITSVGGDVLVEIDVKELP